MNIIRKVNISVEDEKRILVDKKRTNEERKKALRTIREYYGNEYASELFGVEALDKDEFIGVINKVNKVTKMYGEMFSIYYLIEIKMLDILTGELGENFRITARENVSKKTTELVVCRFKRFNNERSKIEGEIKCLGVNHDIFNLILKQCEKLENKDIEEIEEDKWIGLVNRWINERIFSRSLEILAEDKWKEIVEMENSAKDFTNKLNELKATINSLDQTKEDTQKNIDNLINEINQTKIFWEDLENKKEYAEKQVQIYEELENKNIEINNKQKELEETICKLNQKLQENRNEIEAHEQVIGVLRDFGYIPEISKKTSENQTNEIITLSGKIEKVDKYANDEHLKYSPDVLRQFLCAVGTGQIIVLCGPTGTGKTTLPQVIAKALDEECVVISVQTNWTDETDLFGYYNPQEKEYVPTVFLRTLIEAERNPKKQYYIVLDEMNLTRVEYYFATYLSAMETENKTLNLYDKAIIKDRIANIIEEEIGKRDYNGDHIPCCIKIPKNVQIVGTLNMDETTKDLSPKLLDRSYVIELGRANKEQTEDSVNNENDRAGIKITKENLDDIVDEINKRIELIKTEETEESKHVDSKVNIGLSYRSEKHINEMLKKYLADESGDKQVSVTQEDLIQDFLLGKVFPSMHGTEIKQEIFDKICKVFSKELNDGKCKCERIVEKLNKMYDSELEILSYWRGM